MLYLCGYFRVYVKSTFTWLALRPMHARHMTTWSECTASFVSVLQGATSLAFHSSKYQCDDIPTTHKLFQECFFPNELFPSGFFQRIFPLGWGFSISPNKCKYTSLCNFCVPLMINVMIASQRSRRYSLVHVWPRLLWHMFVLVKGVTSRVE